ncbi:calcium-binding protein [Streptomyces sp. CC224B]|uniref:calcium-binding protein n=1 Tax=Streptomyces sp. CC224B TaxID=3044571 RepID=UPI0024A9F72A|nr:calcium-binding protein [Streptomyces sp. CC224B]
MRIRATVAALTGALALSALAVPAAHADEIDGDTRITDVTVNGGKDVVVGTSAKKVTVSVTATDPDGVRVAGAILWHGPRYAEADGTMLFDENSGLRCTEVNAKTLTCRGTVLADPRTNVKKNSLAGGWKVFAYAHGEDDDMIVLDSYEKFSVKRAARLTVNASPEPVKKGKALTVAGALTRANWETRTYAGYTGQPVKLQFKKKGASAYTTVKTVKTDARGKLRTTVKASADGTFRYVFAGSSTTPAVTSAGDAVDVR